MTEPRREVPVAHERLARLSRSSTHSSFGGNAAAVSVKRVLVVEDQPSNQILIAEFLESEGYMVELICDGSAMLEAIHSPLVTVGSLPDLILMDIQLPDVDGFELIKQLKAHALWQRVPVIAVTAMAMLGDRERCLQAGADGYLSKPLNLDRVFSTVRSFAGST